MMGFECIILSLAVEILRLLWTPFSVRVLLLLFKDQHNCIHGTPTPAQLSTPTTNNSSRSLVRLLMTFINWISYLLRNIDHCVQLSTLLSKSRTHMSCECLDLIVIDQSNGSSDRVLSCVQSQQIGSTDRSVCEPTNNLGT